MGLARRTLSLFSWMGPPISFDSGESAASCCIVLGKLLICVKSVGPKKSQTAWTRLETPALGPTSNSLTSPVVPSRATRCPPADAPQTPMWFGS